MNYFKKFLEIYVEISWLYYQMGKGKEKRKQESKISMYNI